MEFANLVFHHAEHVDTKRGGVFHACLINLRGLDLVDHVIQSVLEVLFLTNQTLKIGNV